MVEFLLNTPIWLIVGFVLLVVALIQVEKWWRGDVMRHWRNRRLADKARRIRLKNGGPW
jgi:hypothetical protein